VQQAIAGAPLTVFGNGRQTRCFGYVGDVVKALLALMERPESVGEVFNIGSTEEVSITQLAERVIALTGASSEIVYVPYSEAYEEGFEDMPRRVPDTSKLKHLIGFAPRTSLDDILRAVIHECDRDRLTCLRS
jgi:UDP-glucose 4-epimerase